MGNQNPLPSLIIGAEQPPPQAHQAIQQWGQTVSPRIYGAEEPLYGTLPIPKAPSNAYIMQTGSPKLVPTKFSPVTDYEYYLTVTFPNSFPNGVLSFQFVFGQVNQVYAANQLVAAAFGAVTNKTAIIRFSLYYGDSYVPSVIPISYTAIGF